MSTVEYQTKHGKLPKEAYERFFENKLSDWEDKDKDKDKGKEKSEQKRDKITEEIDTLLKEIKEQYPKDKTASEGSIYIGPLGLSLMFLRLYFARSEKSYLTEGLEYLKLAEKTLPKESEGPSFSVGFGGLYALQAVYATKFGDQQDKVSTAIEKLKDLSKQASQSTKENELLMGKIGYLYSILWINKHLGQDTVPLSLCKPVIEAVFEEGQAEGKEHGHSPLMWKWKGKRYLGAAHGVIGILHTLFCCPLSSQQLELAWGTLEYLINDPKGWARFPSGNWAAIDGEASDEKNDFLVHWCHGAPGMIFLLTKAYQMLKDGKAPQKTSLTQDKLLSEIENAQELIWQRGLLKKGIGLCHGITGNAYCFLHLYRLWKNPKCLHRANAFAGFAIENWRKLTKEKQMDTPSHKCSLLEGMGGAVHFYLDLLEPENSCFPGFEL